MRLLAAAVVASLVLSAVPARAQDVISKESAAELKASVLGDLDTLQKTLVDLKANFRVFTANVSIRAAKWSRAQPN